MKQKKQNTKIRTFRIGWRSEADYSRRMMGCRFGWWVGRGGCDQGGGLLTTDPKSQLLASLAAAFLCAHFPHQASLCVRFAHKKAPSICLRLFGSVGGPKRIRTAVAAFAELSLATRPSDHSPCGVDKYTENSWQGYNSERTKCTFAA